MALPISTGVVRVKGKWTNDYKKDDGTVTTYYNVKCADYLSCDNLQLSVTKDLFDSLIEEEDYILYGSCGQSGKDKWWRFKTCDHIPREDEDVKKK